MHFRPVTVAVAALMATAAAAQSPSPSQDAQSQSPSQYAQPPSPSGNEGGGSVGTVTTQSSDQWLASKLFGSTVYSQNDEKIGTLDDLLLDSKGQPIAAVINNGGILGIGGKKVTLDLKSLKFERSNDGDKIVAPISEKQLKVAAEFKPYTPPPPPPAAPPAGSPASGGPNSTRP